MNERESKKKKKKKKNEKKGARKIKNKKKFFSFKKFGVNGIEVLTNLSLKEIQWKNKNVTTMNSYPPFARMKISFKRLIERKNQKIISKS